MSTVALSHGYPPFWNMGGEVALHRSMKALNGDRFVLTATDKEYVFEGVTAKKIDTPNVLDINADPRPIAKQLQELNARVVIGQNELSLPAVLAAEEANAISIVNVHTPPRYGAGIGKAVSISDYGVYNTHTSASQWSDPEGFVLHPPISPMPPIQFGKGDAYTMLSSLLNKGVEVVLGLAERYPDKRFIIVRSPAEPTHGLKDLEERASKLPNVELHPRVPPEEVYKYLEQTRILLVPSRYETYGMSAIEAAGYGIPSIHVDTPHVREGIGEAAILIRPLDTEAASRGIKIIEKNYQKYSIRSKERANWLQARQDDELFRFADFIDNLKKPGKDLRREKAVNEIMSNFGYY